MGVLEFFGTLVKNDITSSSVALNYTESSEIDHLTVDFNSIIHNSSQKIVKQVNYFLSLTLKTVYNNNSPNSETFKELFQKYKMENIKDSITRNSTAENITKLFKNHFTDHYMDTLVITLVINTLLNIIKTYCKNDNLKTLFIAIDGVPSKGKMIEQKQRRYIGAITELYSEKIFEKYENYLKQQKDNMYYSIRDKIKWSKNKITPGTGFMHRLVDYLKSDKIQSYFLKNRPNLKIIVSDMYEIGEGEKKIVNYINKFHKNTDSRIIIYSPDADVILLCMLLPISNAFMLRYNAQKESHDMINIKLLKQNISYYINNNPKLPKENFESDRINYDLVCLSTLFGNDFVPKIETLNVKKGFQNIMDIYLKVLLKLKDKKYYLVKIKENGFRLNFTFLKHIFRELIPIENDFIKHNALFNEYINIGQIKNVFSQYEITSENLVSIITQFRDDYEQLKNLIKNNGKFTYFETNDDFMESLKKSINIIIDNKAVNTTFLTNSKMIELLKKYYTINKNFPYLNINLSTYSTSIADRKWKKELLNDHINDEYNKELLKFNNMLDEYNIKFNSTFLDLSFKNINNYYREYFDIELNKSNKLSIEANNVMYDYIEGLLWVFNYYFNDTSYISTWYYRHERSPLLQHISQYLDSIDITLFVTIFDNLESYKVKSLKKYFNPLEQLIYVSPMTNNVISLLPSSYKKFLLLKNDQFLNNFFIDTELIVDKLWKSDKSTIIDCKSIPYLNKCFLKPLVKYNNSDDQIFLKIIRNIKKSKISIKRSQNTIPQY